MNDVEQIDLGWILLLVGLRVYLILVDPLCKACALCLSELFLPAFDLWLDWFDGLIDYVLGLLFGAAQWHNHMRRDGEDNHSSDSDPPGPDGANNEGGEFEPNDPKNETELDEDAQALAAAPSTATEAASGEEIKAPAMS